MLKKFHQFVCCSGIIFLMLFADSCANIVTPTGGPKDVTPPQPKAYEPVNFSANFKEHKIKITFNEFITLEDQANQIVVSPPLKDDPEYVVKGKSLLINLPKELKDSVTYTIYFGESIRDITENNILSGLQYAFSTGNHIDSLTITGTVTDALTLEPGKGVFVMLYRSVDDSAPMKHKPDYITKSNSAGLFTLNNLANARYKIFVLADLNSNLLFDQPTEAIAFADSLVKPYYIPRIKDTASAKKDTSSVKKNSGPVKKDTINIKKDTLKMPVVNNQVNLRMFLQPDTIQKLLKARSSKYGQFKLYFKYPVSELSLKVKNKALPDNWRLDEYAKTRDTVTCWLTNPAIDTLKYNVLDKGVLIDSVDMVLKQKNVAATQPKKPSGKGTSNDENSIKPVVYFNAKSGNPFPYYVPLTIGITNPVSETDFSKVTLSEKVDSNFKVLPIVPMNPETSVKRYFTINQTWKPKTKYQIMVLPGAFKDIYGNVNDSAKVIFTPNSVDDYGRVLFTLKSKNFQSPYIVQLLSDSKMVLSEKIVSSQGQLIFENLAPGNYHIRVIRDANKNGKWDSGDYFKKNQPEQVFSFPEVINIRANWDSEFEFTL